MEVKSSCCCPIQFSLSYRFDLMTCSEIGCTVFNAKELLLFGIKARRVNGTGLGFVIICLRLWFRFRSFEGGVLCDIRMFSLSPSCATSVFMRLDGPLPRRGILWGR